MLKAPAGAEPQHVEALLALVCMRPAAGPAPDSQAGDAAAEPPSHFLRTVHLDVSGHALSLAQLQDLLLAAPHRLRQCHVLEGLALAGCQLPPGGAAQRCGLSGCCRLLPCLC